MSSLQHTRLSRLQNRVGGSITAAFSGPWWSRSLQIIGLLMGFLLGSSLTLLELLVSLKCKLFRKVALGPVMMWVPWVDILGRTWVAYPLIGMDAWGSNDCASLPKVIPAYALPLKPPFSLI